MSDPVIVDEWTDEREVGALGFRIVMEGDDCWLEVRVREAEEDGGTWSEWQEEDLDTPREDLLRRLPVLIEAVRKAERASIRRELEALRDEWRNLPDWCTEMTAAINRICPEGL